MALPSQTVIYSYLFERQDDGLDRSGGLDLAIDNIGRFVLQLPQVGEFSDGSPRYSIDQTLFARIDMLDVGVLKEWLIVQTIKRNPTIVDSNQVPAGSVHLRIADANNQYWWNGTSWEVNSTNWNTEGEISTNLSTFPLTNTKITIYVNIRTTDARYTPQVSEIKIAANLHYEAAHFDYVYETVIPALKTIRPIGRLAIDSDGTNSFDFMRDRDFDSSYNMDEIVAVYNMTQDPNRFNDILQSVTSSVVTVPGHEDDKQYNVTLSTTPADGDELRVYFNYEPYVTRLTSRDAAEGTVPAIIVRDIDFTDAAAFNPEDQIIYNDDTGQGIQVPTPRATNMVVTLELETDKNYDLSNLKSTVDTWLNEATITSNALGLGFDVISYGNFNLSHNPNTDDLRAARVTFTINRIVFFERPAFSVRRPDRVIVTINDGADIITTEIGN